MINKVNELFLNSLPSKNQMSFITQITKKFLYNRLSGEFNFGGSSCKIYF